MKNHRTTVIALLLLASALASRNAGAASRNPAGARTALSEAVLVDCAGRFVRISTRTQAILAQGTLWDHSSMAAFRLPSGSFDGCLVADVQLDPRRGLLYAALAREKRLDVEGRRHYRIITLRLPDLRRVRSREIESPVEEGPRLLLSPGRDELFVSYSRSEERSGEGVWLNLVERLSVPALVPVRAREDLRKMSGDSPLPSSVVLSRFAEWASGGRILDKTWVLDEDGRVLQILDPYSLLPLAARSDLKSLERRGAAGQPYLAIAFADSAAQRALFAIGHDAGLPSALGGAALWVYDLGGGSLRPISTPAPVAAYDPARRETPTVHLSPDGDLILLERYEWRTAVGGDPGATARFKTGPVDVYDLATGTLVRTLSLDPAPGFASRLIGISPDGKVALFGAAKRLYVAFLEGDRSPVVLETGESFDAFWTVGVAFR